jgi:hypothetical protein
MAWIYQEEIRPATLGHSHAERAAKVDGPAEIQFVALCHDLLQNEWQEKPVVYTLWFRLTISPGRKMQSFREAQNQLRRP